MKNGNDIEKFQDSQSDINDIGGKAINLINMAKLGLPVPPGFIVKTSAFDIFISQIKADVTVILADADADADTKSALIDMLIDGLDIPQGIAQDILAHYDKLDNLAGLVAVRSSATSEDLPDASFAGQHSTVLNVNRDKLLDAVKECWQSLYNSRAISYRQYQGIADSSIAVVIQSMVQADVAGIMFTANSVNGDTGTIVIEAGRGIGELVVSGEITPDNYQVSKTTLDIVNIRIASQATMLTDMGIVEVPQDLQDTRKLTDSEIVALAQIGLDIEAHYGKPQDIEFGYRNSQLYILQTRAITTL